MSGIRTLPKTKYVLPYDTNFKNWDMKLYGYFMS